MATDNGQIKPVNFVERKHNRCCMSFINLVINRCEILSQCFLNFWTICSNLAQWKIPKTAYVSHKPLLGQSPPREASPHAPQFCNVTKDEECFPRLPNFSALLCGVSSVSFRWFFLLSNCLVVEVGEGCRQRELSLGEAPECVAGFFGGDGCCMPGIICMCVCVCVSPSSHGNPWQQVWHVVMGNYAAQCKTFSERGHPLSALPSA